MAGRVSGSSGLGGPKCRIWIGERPQGMPRENGGEPKAAHIWHVGRFNWRSNMIAVASAMMMRIPFVAIGRHLVRVARNMAKRSFVYPRLMR